MSGIGSSLADLDKEVNKSVPGGWVTIGGLALGGAGAAGAFSGLGAGAAGAAGAFSGLGAGAAGAAGGTATGTGITAGTTAAGGMALGSAANVAASNAAMGLGGSAIGAAAPSAIAAPAAYGTLAGANSAAGMLATQQAAGLAGAANPFSISPMQAMMANKALGGFGQQQPSGQSASVGIKRGQPVNTADPILALLAPKMKKKQPISLL